MSKNKLVIILVSILILVMLLSIALFLRHEIPSPSAFATKNASASVTITILSSLSIQLVNDTIDFGSCAINRTQGYLMLDSSLGPTGANNSNCVAGSYPDYLLLENDGSVPVNVTVQFNETGQSFFNDSDSWFAYKTLNASTLGGCVGESTSYVNVTSTNIFYAVCNNLTSGSSSRMVEIYLQTRINSSASSSGQLSLNFIAAQVD